MSFMLLGIPQNRKRAVTRKNGNIFPAANIGGCCSELALAFRMGISEAPISKIAGSVILFWKVRPRSPDPEYRVFPSAGDAQKSWRSRECRLPAAYGSTPLNHGAERYRQSRTRREAICLPI